MSFKHVPAPLAKVCLLTLAVAMGSCNWIKASSGPTVAGFVVNDSTGRAQVGATVHIPGREDAVAQTDSQGYFTFTPDYKAGTLLHLSIKAPGFETVYRTVRSPAGVSALGDVRLRPVGLQQTVTLPEAGQDPVQISLSRFDGATALRIPANSMVTADGNIAHGDADVSLTYWYPREVLDSAPGLLIAADPNNPNSVIPLDTYGMTSIEVRQNGQLLQVAPGSTVELQMTQPLQLRGALEKASPEIMPDLWYLDPNIGLWSLVGTVRGGAMRYATDSNMFIAQLPHLSAWNVDGSMYLSNGGCVTGKVFDACNPTTPLANTPVKVWFLGTEQTKDWNATSNGTGQYCVNTPLSNFNATTNYSEGVNYSDIKYMVTSQSDITNTNYCDPLPPACQSCDPTYEAYNYETNFCNTCGMAISPAPVPPPAGPVYNDCASGSPTANIVGCNFCAGDPSNPGSCTLYGGDGIVHTGSCAQLQPVYLRGPGCNCGSLGGACGPGGSCCPGTAGETAACNSTTNTCAVCNVSGLGKPCRPALDTCCPDPVAGPLVCNDYLCVPVVDP